MLERTVFHGKRPKCWNTTAVRGLGPATGDPASETEPEVTGSRPAIVRSKVVLPPPDVPTTQTNSRLATARLTPCRMRAPPSSTQTLSRRRWVMAYGCSRARVRILRPLPRPYHYCDD